MNILELDSFNLADAVKFNDELNPRIWDGEKMRPEVRKKLLEIAADFKEFLGLSDLEVKDITVSGSNAAYTYTPQSDIDLHLIVDIPRADADEVYRELFDAKKYEYNDIHNIKIGGYDVELYVENANKPPVSKGVFSVLNNDWISIPRQRKATIDDDSVRSKYEDIKHRIEDAVKSNDNNRISTLARKIKAYRQAGLDKHGELGSENLAYKMLRNQGYIERLYKARAAARDAELSLAEQNKEKKPVVYGFKTEDVTLTPDGVSPSTKMFLSEKDIPSHTEIIFDFMKYAVHELDLHNVPTLKIKKDPQWSVIHKSFGRYRDDLGQIELAVGNRHIMDVLRTLAHELQHRKQDEREHMPPGAGATGSPYENEAHVVAGILMRQYADMHPEYFEDVPVSESASGYIPTAREKNDPRFKMALTRDIKPGQVGKEANKMALDTDRQGKPALIFKSVNQLDESIFDALKQFKKSKPKSYGYGSTPLTQEPGSIEDALGNQEATGPEFPPQMPAGTTKIDVSDLTDWYRLGMDISDMDDADPADYNQGPPQTVIVFPSDEAEQGYLKQFKRLGLKTHDLDPDVAGGEDVYGKHLNKKLAEELQAFKEQDLFEIKMSPSSLKAEAAKTGAQAGMEFEMIVPDVVGGGEPEYEPDMDQDTRTRDFDDIRNFFYDGDYNGRRDVDRLIEELQNAFIEWQDEQIFDSWADEGFELVRDYIKDNDLFDEEEAQQEATNELQAAYGDDISPEEFQKMLEQLVQEKFDEFVTNEYNDQGRAYNDAQEMYFELQREENDEREWLNDNYPYMSDISQNFDIQWPYYIDINQGDGEADVERVANDFSDAVDMRVNYSTSYHGGRREPDAYVVEPDSSLDPDNSEDYGLEFVSPPMEIDQMVDQLNKVKAWADSYGCYTNKSTGLHINISVPNYDLSKLDYVKLALLLGDKYILDQYGRSSNTYAKSALGKVQELIKRDPSKGKDLLDKMRGHMEDLATKAIHSGSTDKYTSINTKSGYIEFRSPGGDWLNANFDKIENTLMRFTVALSAAMNPEAYREEYLKKLYKLLEPVAEETPGIAGKGARDTVQYFADYVAGKTPRAALRSFVKQAQLERRIKRGDVGGAEFKWEVGRPGYHASIIVRAKTKEEAIDRALEPDGYPDWASARSQLTAKPIGPADTAPVRATAGEPQPVGQRSGAVLDGRPSNPDGNWVISPENDRSAVAYRFMAADRDDAELVARQWRQANPGQVWITQRDDNRTLGQPEPVRATGGSTGQRAYEIFRQDNPQTVVAAFLAADDQAAMVRLDRYRADHPGVDYRARRAPVPGSTLDLQRQRAAQAQAQAGGVINTANEPTTGDGVGQTYNPSGTGEFTGQWLVLDPNNRVIYRFGGVGNSQSDANRTAMQWLQRNPAQMQDGVTVVPELA